MSVPPILPTGPVNPVPFANPVSPRPAPRGVGDAPTTAPLPPDEKGYIKRLVIYLKDCIVWLFTKISSFFKKEEPAPPPPQPEPPPNPERARHLQLLQQIPFLLRGEEILGYFIHYFPAPEQRNYIFNEIGRTAPSSWRHAIGQSYSIIGQRMVEQNAKLLLPYLMAEVHRVANS